MSSINQKFYFRYFLSFAVGQNTTISNSTSSSDAGCADYFGVSECSTCQKSAYGASDESVANCLALTEDILNGTAASDSNDNITDSWVSVYSAIPNMQAICSQASDESYCAINFRSNLGNYTILYLGLSPPVTVTQRWLDFSKMNPPSIPALKSLLDQDIKTFEGNLTQCFGEKNSSGEMIKFIGD
ncbi:10117_t:CDS:2 [Ambispora gerdemannii]|uniref:10117_t:CDS:1 n=1 Tax=Ambispora gerdemannii TaxID=144530 RepID=A0A9N8YUB1_9GLOM|nr:10117_t:CDS:2 [Ambispora gerdemannii]